MIINRELSIEYKQDERTETYLIKRGVDTGNLKISISNCGEELTDLFFGNAEYQGEGSKLFAFYAFAQYKNVSTKKMFFLSLNSVHVSFK